MRIDKTKFEIARAKNCISMPELAEKSGLARGTLYKSYRNDVQPQTVGMIAKALNVDVKDIIQED